MFFSYLYIKDDSDKVTLKSAKFLIFTPYRYSTMYGFNYLLINLSILFNIFNLQYLHHSIKIKI